MPSRRTAEADKAIRLAWKREQELVQQGKGTRDWSEEQQQTILDPEKGRAYDNKGRAFQGQHMRSVSEHPECQGDPDNIQFLTREEHLEAHKGNWKTPTNWYYDPVTKEFTDFGKGPIQPCKSFVLSDPISPASTGEPDVKKVQEKGEKGGIPESHKSDAKNPPPPRENEKTLERGINDHKAYRSTQKKEKGGVLERILNFAKRTGSVGKKMIAEHPVLSSIIKGGLILGGGFLASKVAGKSDLLNKNHSSNEDNDNSTSDDTSSVVNDVLDKIFPSDLKDDNSDMSSEFEEKEEEEASSSSSKSPHPRRGYPGHRWKKNEDGELELTETWIKETFIHKEQLEEDSEE